MKSFLKSLFFLSVLACSQTYATSINSNFQPSVTILPTCTINVVNTASFIITPTSDPTAYQTSSRPAIIRCTRGTPYSISLSAGNSGNVADRTMTSSTSSDKLHYTVYTNTAMGTIWGDGTNGSATVLGTGSAISVNSPPVVKVFTNQFLAPGTYTDTLTYMISY